MSFIVTDDTGLPSLGAILQRICCLGHANGRGQRVRRVRCFDAIMHMALHILSVWNVHSVDILRHTDSWNVRRSRIQEMSKTAFQLAKPYILALKSAGIYTIADLLAIRHLLVSPSTPRSNAQMQAKFVALPNHQGGSLPKLPTPLQLAIHTALQHILALDGESPRAAKIHRSLTGRSVQDPNNGAATAMGGADTVKLPPIRNSRAASASNAGDPPPLRRAGTSSSVRSQGDNFPYHSYSPRAASADNGHQRGSLSHRTVDTHHSRSNPSSARR